MRHHRDLTEQRVDLVALERRDPFLGRVVDGDHDVGIGQQSQFHGFFEKAAFPLVEAYLLVEATSPKLEMQ